METFVELIVPLPIPRFFTYSVPEEWAGDIKVGSRVVVPFGQKKYYTGIVRRILFTRPEGFDVKPLRTLLDAEPILLPSQLRLWEWISSYYLCSVGDVMKASLPAGLKPEGNTEEGLQENYRPRMEIMLRLGNEYCNEEALQKALDQLKRAQKQQLLLFSFLNLTGWGEISEAKKKLSKSRLSRRELLAHEGASPALLQSLLKRGILEQYEQETGRLSTAPLQAVNLHPLSIPQREAFNAIKYQFDRGKSICLLHGVTSSGKTEIYIHLIEEALQRGEQVLYLLPEIALTTQITERLKRVFGERLGIYHSKFSDEIRVEIWQKQLSSQPYDIILGARSSLFLPFRKLGLIIVDEEHENSYKQYDPAPRYHARNTALVLASYFQARTLLGSATPSVESYHLAKEGKYELVELNIRYQDIQMPLIVPVDIKELRRKKRMNGSFSPTLLQAIDKALQQNEQVILFQNRRGFAPMIECRTCGWVPRCKNCDVSLTYHKSTYRLTCHYCGYTETIPSACPACEESNLQSRGIGTERIEDEISQIFPQARLARMDMDTAHTRTQYETILSDFQQQKTDILIGTQMISKGLDFDHVSIVGILDSDTMLNFPDFRAHERAFQLMAQVAGRAGRKEKRGTVILQTRSIDHPVIQHVIHNDYIAMYQTQMQERKLFRYPPHYRLIYLFLKHRDPKIAEEASRHITHILQRHLQHRVMGPIEPVVSRIQQLFIRQTILKIEHSAHTEHVRQVLHYAQQELSSHAEYRSVLIYYDVDPM